MSKSNQINLSLSFTQLFELARQLPIQQKKKLIKVLQSETIVDNLIDKNDFVLSAQQLELLDKRSKTPIDNCITASDSLKQIKKKYGI
ncbi:MAG: hypothetical protein ACK50L_14425 [Bacteroidota bacterium]|jgi:hypothetical protein